MQIQRVCPITKELKVRELNVTFKQLEDWFNGANIQDVFPHLTSGEREFIVSGITEDIWEGMFAEDEM